MISIKTTKQIEAMAEGGRILATILQEVAKAVQPGVSTLTLDKLARELILFYKVKSSFLGYGGFPAVICISINDEVVHGIPSAERILQKGDIVGLDFGVIDEGLHTDSAITVPVLGDISYEEWVQQNSKAGRLIEVTKKALEIGIAQVKHGVHVGEIGHAVQKYIESEGFGIVRDLVGHGIGSKLHEDPYVPNFGDPEDGPILKEGMTIAIEPMVNVGDWKVKLAKDGWTYKTADGSLSAHFEHTVLVTKDGGLVLTEI